MKIKMVVVDLELSTRAKRIAAAVAIPLLILGGGAVAYANVPHTWKDGDVLKAEDLNENFSALSIQLSKAGQDNVALLKKEPFFAWTFVKVPASSTPASPLEGMRTITFDEPGTYRITLNVHSVIDSTATAEIWWILDGTATRLDSFNLEGGGKNIRLDSAQSRLASSTTIFVKAAAGQTLTIKPQLSVVYADGDYHGATFMYAIERLGPPR